MTVERSIRSMTPQERQAKREWGTGACQARGCTARAAFLIMEQSGGDPRGGDWWQYSCPKHALRFAEEHGLELPPVASKPTRAAAV